MKTIVMMVGLPRSGKSTVAKKISKDNGWPVVNPDSVRLATHGKRFWGPGEPQVWTTVRVMVDSLFKAGHDTVILDSTNLTEKRRMGWHTIGGETVDIKYVMVPTAVEICKKRAEETDQKDLKDVIDKMDAKIEWPHIGDIVSGI